MASNVLVGLFSGVLIGVAMVAVATQFALIWLLKRRLQGKMAFGR